MPIAFLGLNHLGQAAGPAANQEKGGGKELKLSNPVTLQQGQGLDPMLALDARSGALYVAWARRGSDSETAPLEVVVARSEDGGRSFADPSRRAAAIAVSLRRRWTPPQIAVGPKDELYVLYHRQVASKILERGRSMPRLTRSTDGGSTFDPAVDVGAVRGRRRAHA